MAFCLAIQSGNGHFQSTVPTCGTSFHRTSALRECVTVGLQTASQDFPLSSLISEPTHLTLHGRGHRNNDYCSGHVKPLDDDELVGGSDVKVMVTSSAIHHEEVRDVVGGRASKSTQRRRLVFDARTAAAVISEEFPELPARMTRNVLDVYIRHLIACEKRSAAYAT